jgi:iron complex outermembrane receptor protein
MHMHPMKSAIRRSALRNALIVAMAMSGAAQAAEDKKPFDIAAQPAATALNQFAEQADITLVFPQAQVVDIRTGPLRGDYSVAEGLARMLAGTRLTYQQTGERTIAIVDRGAAPGTSQTAQLAQSGEGAQEEEVAAPRPGEVVEIEKMVVTGSRLQRTEFEGPSSVTLITREEIDRSGYSTVRELLNTVPQGATSRDESGAGAFLGASTIQLRGLSQGSTLILINGRRVTASASQFARNYFDLNSIPLEAIDRVEILTDTASAVYGGDAVGGAVNFILRKDFEGVVAGSRYGTSYRGDATERNVSITLGGGGEQFNGLVVFDLFERDPVLRPARSLTADSDFRRFGGIDLRSTLSFPANIYALPGQGNLPGLRNRFAGVPQGTDGIGLTPQDFAATDGVLNRFELAPFQTLISETRRFGTLATGDYRFDNGVSMFAELMFTRNAVMTSAAPDVLFGGSAGLFVVPASNPYNPFGVAVGVDYRTVELGPRLFDAENQFGRGLAGLQGTWGEIDWELSLLADNDQSTLVERNYINAATVRTALTSTDPSRALNVFCSTLPCNSPAILASIRSEPIASTRTGATMAEANLAGRIDGVFGQPLSWAVGASARKERLTRDRSDQPDADLNVSRDVVAGYFELLQPLVPSSDDRRLELSLAGRYDDYSTFGSSFNPQLGLLWKPTRWLLLRASGGTAFKTPSLNDTFGNVNVFDTVVSDPLRNNEPVQIILTQGPNEDIQPEEATSLTFGFILEPETLAGFSFGATAFRVEQEDFIVRLPALNDLLRNPQLFGDRIRRADPTAQDLAAGLPGRLLSLDRTALNFGGVVVRGVDLQNNYRFRMDRFGDFVWSLSGSYVDSYKVTLQPGQAAREQVGNANDAGYPARFKGNTGLTWAGNGGLGANVFARYLSSYTDYDGVREMPANWWYDLQLSYDFSAARWPMLRGLRASVGAINLGNNQGDYSNNFAGYDPRQADLRGRFFYLNLKYVF